MRSNAASRWCPCWVLCSRQLGLVAGAPAVLGAWIGAAAFNPSIASLLFGLGVGANIELSARANIELLLRFEGIRPDSAMVETIWRFTELDRKFFDLSLRHFSTGMMMRLFFAISTASHPEILLMDEWLSVMDEKIMIKAEERLRGYIGKASLFVIASHNLQLLREVCDRILFLESGTIKSIEDT